MKKIKRILKRIKFILRQCVQKAALHIGTIICTVIAVLGTGLIAASFVVPPDWSSVLSGLGTGAFTSLIVSLIINYATEKRSKREKENAKQFVFSKMISCAINIYSTLIYKVNEFTLFSEQNEHKVYALYDNFSTYDKFEELLKKIDYTECDDAQKQQLSKLFDFPQYQIKLLASEIRNSSKRELYLQGIISQNEYTNFLNNYTKEAYLLTVDSLSEFWDGKVINYEKCVRFLRANLYICSRIISAIGNKDTVSAKEETIIEELDDRYFNEVEVYTDKFLEWERQQAEEMAKYYQEHPEILAEMHAAWEAEENRTPTERTLLSLHDYIHGMAWDESPVENLLKKLDPNDTQVTRFFRDDIIKKALKRNKKLRRSIENTYGKKYLTVLWKTKV